ncbi:MAG: hypothetical protein AUJ49_01200 [Desulfovibrionaceae bacterium CG1_02_65_16]|nr:MAG: hypothetical protein AUJ49_01200 [Desulfovibrionaceae bacterium CG1_02_65_16]
MGRGAKAATRGRTDPHGTLLLVNADCCGHFLVYCNVLAEWALSRGLRVDYLGPLAEGRTFARLHEADSRVRFLDAAGVADGADWGEPFSCGWIRRAQERLRPELCVLLNGDALLFESMELLEPGVRFPAPTWAVATFAHRERDACFGEPYTARLNELLNAAGPGVGPFAGLFTLDERHARACPGGGARFLPDMYRDFVQPARALRSREDIAVERALLAFLDGGSGPVLPLLGKFDRRKNPLWALRLAAGRSDMRVVVLGERVSGPGEAEDDAEIDALLDRLHGLGRAFVRFSYVSEALFDAVLRHPCTGMVPLPYQCHFGSSGIQLMAHRRGRPVLVSDQGLMAARVRAWNLGRVFRVGDEEDFHRQYAELERLDPASFAPASRAFMRYFSRARLWRALDVMLETGPLGPLGLSGRGGQGGARPPRIAPCPAQGQEDAAAALFRRGLDAAAGGDLPAALALLEASLAREPKALHRLLRMGVVLWRMGRLAEARQAFAAARSGGLAEEQGFFARLTLDLCVFLQRRGEHSAGLSLLATLFAVLPGFPAGAAMVEAGTSTPESVVNAALENCDLPWSVWRTAGDALVHTKAWDSAARCYARAWELAPEEGGLALSISDVQRYAGSFAEALQTLDLLEARAPDQPGLWCKRGQTLAAAGRAEDALAAFARELAGSPFAEAAAGHAHRVREAEAARRAGADG